MTSVLYDSSWPQCIPELACLSQGTGSYWAVSEMEGRFWNELEKCRLLRWGDEGGWTCDSCQVFSGEGVSSLALLFRGAGQLLLTNLHVFGGALSQYNTPDFQKCCYLAGQRFLNQLTKTRHLLSNG